MALKGKPVAVGNTATTIYTCPATKEAAVHGLLFGNNTASALAVDVIVYNQATGSDITVVTDLAVPANGIATWSKPINLNAGDAVKAVSSAASGMVCLYSTYEDGATPVASGFTARGAWSSSATYVANDIVSVSGSGTYVAIQGSTNQDPTTATAYWMFLEGISASALPAQSGNAGKYLTTDGSTASWGEVDVSGGTEIQTLTADLQLTSANKRYQKIISNTTDNVAVILPSATSLNKGESFTIVNYGNKSILIKDYDGGLITSVPSQIGFRSLILNNNSTTAGDWTSINGSTQSGFAKAGEVSIGIEKGDYDRSAAIISINDDLAIAATCTNDTLYLTAIDGGDLSKGTSASFSIAGSGTNSQCNPNMCQLDTDKFALFYMYFDGGSTYTANVRVCTVNQSTKAITVGSAYTLGSDFYNSGTWTHKIVQLDTNKFFAISSISANPYQIRAKVGSVSGTAVTYGATWNGYWDNWVMATCFVRSPTEIHVFDTNDGNASSKMQRVTISGTSTSSTSYDIDDGTGVTKTISRNSCQEVSMDSNNDAYTLKMGTVLYRLEYNTGTSEYNLISSTGMANASGDVQRGGGIISVDSDTVGVIMGASGGLEGTGTSFRTLDWNAAAKTYNQNAITLLEQNDTQALNDYVYDGGQQGACKTSDTASILYIGYGLDNVWKVGKVGTTVV